MAPLLRQPLSSSGVNSPYHELNTQCTFPGCTRWFKGQVGLNQHILRSHSGKSQPVEASVLSSANGNQTSCDTQGTVNNLDLNPSNVESWFEFICENTLWANVDMSYLDELDMELLDLGLDEDVDSDVDADMDIDADLDSDVGIDLDVDVENDAEVNGGLNVSQCSETGSTILEAESYMELRGGSVSPSHFAPLAWGGDQSLLAAEDPSTPVEDTFGGHMTSPAEDLHLSMDASMLAPVECCSSPIPSPPGLSSEPLARNATQGFKCHYHDFLTGDVCDPDESPVDNPTNKWAPFTSRLQFETAAFLYRRDEMSAGYIDTLLKLWDVSLAAHGDCAPFRNHKDLYQTIDLIPFGEIPWKSLTIRYPDEYKEGPKPSWMQECYVIWYRDPMQVLRELIANPDFKDEFDFVPYHEYGPDGHRFQDFMSGNWVWRQADLIKNDPKAKARGAFYVPIILGSDKTTVSIATGNNEYWPLYISIGNIHNVARRGHRNGVVVVAFLSTPKAEKEQRDTNEFRKFRRQLFHTSLTSIFKSVHSAMVEPVKVKCNDGKYRRAIFGFGPYIANYPEQCLLTCIVQCWCPKCLASSKNLDNPHEPVIPRTTYHTQLVAHDAELLHAWDTFGMITDVMPFTEFFPRADIYEMISPDILHQLIKGTFKDHLVTWIGEYLVLEYGRVEAKRIMDDIDRRIAIVPSFPNLRRFPQGQDFKQWTGNNSKALMKVYLPALRGYIPEKMLCALRALLEFSYLARQNSHSVKTLQDMELALDEFHKFCEVFVETGVRSPDSWPPRQHSLKHYIWMIHEFGSPNGLCSSITESKHIDAVKKPWRRSNRHNALNQMLVINSRSDKLRAAYNHFKNCGLLDDTLELTGVIGALLVKTKGTADEDDDGTDDLGNNATRPQPSVELSATATARNLGLQEVITHLSLESFADIILDHISSIHDLNCAQQSRLQLQLPHAQFVIHPSTVAMYYAPSDYVGTTGMHRERIRAVPSWRRGPARYDTVFYRDENSEADTITTGLKIGRVHLFFSFSLGLDNCRCALIHEFGLVDSSRRDDDTGMWVVAPQFQNSEPKLKVVALDRIFRAAHLVPVYNERIPNHLNHMTTLDDFDEYFVNRFIDYHAFWTAI